jgi:3-oxoacyl-[acyl-carrier protein] reductase
VARLAQDAAAADAAAWIVADNADPATPARLIASAVGSITGTGASVVFVLSSSVRVPLAELAISNRLFPGLAGVVKLDARRGDPDEVRARLSEHIPLRRHGEPEEFGRAAAFLLSPARSTSPAR